MSDTDQTKALIDKYHELAARRKQSVDPSERTRLTQELMDLEGQVRNAVKANPVPEPLGMDKLNKIADQMTQLGFGIFANRLRGQHYRHPIYVPFADMDQLRSYIAEQLPDEALAQIPELGVKAKKPGLFEKMFGKKK
ncbi:MAG: hypothetical protein QM715_11315 [Nibricoccus sp.]